MKKFTIISLIILLCFTFIGCKTDNSISKKESVVINLPKDDTVNGYRTDKTDTENTIISDNITITHNNATYSLWGNKNSKKYHTVSCTQFKKAKDENKVYFETEKDFINKGYTPCKSCNP